MRLINSVLRFLGFTAFVIAASLNFLDYQSASVLAFAIAAVNFLVMLSLHVYKIYMIANLKSNNNL